MWSNIIRLTDNENLKTDDEEGELVIVEDDNENDRQSSDPKNRFFCLPCQNHFAEEDKYSDHISR